MSSDVAVGFVLFPELTALDFVGAYDPVTRLSSMGYLDLSWDLCVHEDATIRDDRGLAFAPTRACDTLEGYDVLVVPGGFGTRALEDDESFLAWLRTNDADLLASVCTGSLLLGAAGYLEGKRATTHPTAYDDLEPYCAEVVEERVVEDGDVVTARGVSSGIDLGLHLCTRLADESVRDEIAAQMDYPY
ncbi:MAG: DJ-1/PfpI family protein [Haloarculaceae archaeon]